MHKLSAALAIVMISTTAVHSSPTTPRLTKEQVEAFIASTASKYAEPRDTQRIEVLRTKIKKLEEFLADFDPRLLNLTGPKFADEEREKLKTLKIELQKALAER